MQKSDGEIRVGLLLPCLGHPSACTALCSSLDSTGCCTEALGVPAVSWITRTNGSPLVPLQLEELVPWGPKKEELNVP